MKKFTLFDFTNDNSLRVGETSWIQDLPRDDKEVASLLNANENVLVNWPAEERKTEKQLAKVISMSDDPQELIEIIQKILEANEKTEIQGLQKGKRKQIETLSSKNEEREIDQEQQDPSSGTAFLPTESSSDDEESLIQLSKVELCAKIKNLKQKLSDTMTENCRLRQSLVTLQVLPQAVTHFEELVGMAAALLKRGGVPSAPSLHSQGIWKPAGNSIPDPYSKVDSNSSSFLPSKVEEEEHTIAKEFKIEKWQIALCNKSKPQKFINDIMQALYTNEYMATHSLTGAKSSSSKEKAAKPAMNQNEVQEIIGVTKELFPNTDDALIRRMMGQKLNNCTKKPILSQDLNFHVFRKHAF
ncbi:BEN domain-containing protein 6 isoform X2 [Notamacropus eugenii]|uniref:BEN domain-containing protein 6 isoform X2 n=1 Tax=Notamacropus eugenii TaxID=9315 RepID=UPI003B68419A